MLACVACNAHKANRTPDQAAMKLRRAPTRPSWKPLYDATGIRDRELVPLPQRRLLECPSGSVVVIFVDPHSVPAVGPRYLVAPDRGIEDHPIAREFGSPG